MGFKTFWKHVFFGYEEDDPELKAAREKYGIEVGDDEDDEEEKERKKAEYDPWDELKDMRMNFFLGNWAARKFRIIGEDKVKKELEELARKREEEAKRKAEKEVEGEG